MFALKAQKNRGSQGQLASKAYGSSSSLLDTRLVMPKPLRRMTRFMVSLASGRVHIPNHTGTVSAVAFLAATGFYGMSLGGYSDTVARATTNAAGFAVEDVRVSGNSETSEIDILEKLGLDGSTSLVALDVKTAREKLAELPWVEDVEVRKIYPKAVEVKLKERKAYAIWQHGQELSLIEKNGSVIAPLQDNKFTDLPLVVGRDAETAAAKFDVDFAAWPGIRDQVKAYVRIAGRRWDLHMKNGVLVRLPETGVEQALLLLTRMETEQNLLERDIAAVDLRLPDRTAIQLTPGAVERRQVVLDARTKALKKIANPT